MTVGSVQEFELSFLPDDYTLNPFGDISCDTPGVSIGYGITSGKIFSISIAETVAVGTEANVFFKSQKIMHVVVEGQSIVIEPVNYVVGEDEFVFNTEGIELPQKWNSTSLINLTITSNGSVVEKSLNMFDEFDDSLYTSNAEPITPVGRLYAESLFGGPLKLQIQNSTTSNGTITITKIVHNGAVLYDVE